MNRPPLDEERHALEVTLMLIYGLQWVLERRQARKDRKADGPWEDEDPRHYAHRMGDPDV